jgi:hypothetical protein
MWPFSSKSVSVNDIKTLILKEANAIDGNKSEEPAFTKEMMLADKKLPTYIRKTFKCMMEEYEEHTSSSSRAFMGAYEISGSIFCGSLKKKMPALYLVFKEYCDSIGLGGVDWVPATIDLTVGGYITVSFDDLKLFINKEREAEKNKSADQYPDIDEAMKSGKHTGVYR